MAPGKLWYMEFNVGDWIEDPAVTLLRLPTRAVWLDAICRMFQLDQCGRLVGTVSELAKLCRCTHAEMRSSLDDLKDRDAADVTERDGVVTLTNRRMRRAWEERNSARERKQRQRRREVTDTVTTDVTPPSAGTLALSQSKPSNMADGGSDLRTELERLGITDPMLSRCAEIPGLTAVEVLLLAEEATKLQKKNPGGWVISMVTMPDYRPPQVLDPVIVSRLAAYGWLWSIAGHVVYGKRVLYGSGDMAGVHFGDQHIKAADLTPAIVVPRRGR